MTLRGSLAFVLALAVLAPPTAVAESSSKGGLSKGGGLKSSSKSGSKSSSKSASASKSKSAKSKPSTRSSKSASSRGSKDTPATGAALASPPVHEDGSDADDVHIRGGYLSEANFAALPCEPIEVSVGARRCWRCADQWFERLVYGDQPVYVEVFAPEGAQVDRLPERVQSIRGESATYFAAADAIYAPSQDGSGGYVVVATSPGFRVEELPDAARVGAPIVADGATYYRYLGVYYREVRDGERAYYVASESPF